MAIPWHEIVAHRERLLAIARRRVATREDAEDVVQEAMLRAATFGALDDARLGQFLTAVTLRLCADVHRNAARGARAIRRLDVDAVTAGPEDAAVAAAEAAELRALLDSLPLRQRDVLVERAEGLSVTEISTRHALTYKATESSLSRARATMRLALAAAMSAVAAACATIRRRPGAVVTAAALPIVAVGLVTTVHRGPDATEAAPAAEPPAAASEAARSARRAEPLTNVAPPARVRPVREGAPPAKPDPGHARPARPPGPYRDFFRYDPPGDDVPDVVVSHDGETPEEMVRRCATTDGISVTVAHPDKPGPAVDVYCHPAHP